MIFFDLFTIPLFCSVSFSYLFCFISCLCCLLLCFLSTCLPMSFAVLCCLPLFQLLYYFQLYFDSSSIPFLFLAVCKCFLFCVEEFVSILLRYALSFFLSTCFFVKFRSVLSCSRCFYTCACFFLMSGFRTR